ncbi:glycosyltransferase [Flaviramulus aquimarinus]|uniref:Glycosyltransferase n=1 Tax=Flaviramulus aquimarinus TaxID=1170456 RepID=A0ABP9EP66_9FLAO
MKFLIITHVKHKLKEGHVFAYGPYVREMNIWLKYVDEIHIVAPKAKENTNAIDLVYEHESLSLKEIPSIEFTSLRKVLGAVLKIPLIIITIFKACRKTDHIHLRCPGNIGLLGCLVQICFSKKIKTAKYAGNWDPKASQPLSYRFQKKLLANTFLTKNMTALIYGNWPNQTKNIKSFFTATYANDEKEPLKIRDYSKALKFLFVGSLVEGKRPLFAIKIIEALYKTGREVILDIYGEGSLKKDLQKYITDNNLELVIKLYGNKEKYLVKEAFKGAHFLILPSKSEGWPKAIAEAMFFGTIPISTSISCVPYMLGFGERGILIEPNLKAAISTIEQQLNRPKSFNFMSKNAVAWSQEYTLDTFENEIVKLLKT